MNNLKKPPLTAMLETKKVPAPSDSYCTGPSTLKSDEVILEVASRVIDFKKHQ
jgi:hypothetical protein